MGGLSDISLTLWTFPVAKQRVKPGNRENADRFVVSLDNALRPFWEF